MNTYRVASFVANDCLGNPHAVCVDPNFSAAEKEKWLKSLGDAIAVLLFTGDSSPRAEFHQLGHAILRCGSGTLAAAHVLFRELGLKQVTRLNTPAGEVSLRQSGDYLGYGARGLPLKENTALSAWQPLLNQEVLSSSYIGGENDYCLVELANRDALANLRVDTAALARFSGRALIATAGPADSYDYVLRYFAPRHGKDEDPATGSANLQVAAFWRERLSKSSLHGRQLSQSGGEFLLEISSQCTWVMGKTRAG